MASQEHHAPALGIVKPKGIPDLPEEKVAQLAQKDLSTQKMSFAEAVKHEIEHNAEEYQKQQKIQPEIVKDIKAVMPEEKITFSSSGLPEAREPMPTRSDTSTNIQLGDQRLGQDFRDLKEDLKDKARDKIDDAKNLAAEKTGELKQGATNLKDQVVEKVGDAKDFVADKAGSAKEFVGEKIHSVQEGAVHLKDQVVEKISGIAGGIKETLGHAAEKTSETAEKAASTVKGGLVAAKDKGAEVLETTKEESSSLLEKAREGLETLKERVGSWLGNTEQKMEETIEGTPSETIKEGDVTVQNKPDRVDVGRQEIITEEQISGQLEGEGPSILERAKEGLETIKETVVHAATAVKEKVLGPGETAEEGTKKKLEA